jgi:hypothetical protein
MMNIEVYKENWSVFRKYVERKAKNRCVINNKNWLKLRDYHFTQFVKEMPSPYGFLFHVVYFSDLHKRIPCSRKLYMKYKKQRDASLTGVCYRPKNRVESFKKYR